MINKITDLPPEMVQQIFGHLQHREKLLVSSTCKDWRKLIFNPRFCKRSFLHIRTIDEIEQKLRDSEISQVCRNAVISCEFIPDEHRALLKDYLCNSPIETLQIVAAKETVKWFLECILSHMKTLETLYIDLRDSNDEILRICHPSLKNVVIEIMGPFELKCPELRTFKTHIPDGKCVGFLNSLHNHLYSLTLSSRVTDVYAAISCVKWHHLTELCMNLVPRENHIGDLLKQMPCLKKLVLHDHYTVPSIGKEFATAKSLKDLVLVKVNIDADFTRSLNRLAVLENLTLINVLFTPLGKEERLQSGSVKRFTFVHRKRNPLPQFPNLETLDLQCDESELYDILKDLCLYYPKLERLYFGVPPGQIGVFQTESDYPKAKSLLHLKQLNSLRTLQLNRLATEVLDWSLYHDNSIESLRLNGCSIDGTTADKFVEVFKHLHQLYFDHCYLRQPRTDIFDLEGNIQEGLRSCLPGCVISYFDCHIEDLLEGCGSKRSDVILC